MVSSISSVATEAGASAVTHPEFGVFVFVSGESAVLVDVVTGSGVNEALHERDV